MIYQLGQVSNRDVQLLYTYRMLRHNSQKLNALYSNAKPDIYILDKPTQSDAWYEYHIDCTPRLNYIPYLEFYSDNETVLKNIDTLVEVETLDAELILRGHTDMLEGISVYLYWVPSLAYIEKLQSSIVDTIKDLTERYQEDEEKVQSISVSNDYVMSDVSKPNLIAIDADDIGLVYGDSHYMLSGSVEEQTITNPTQQTISEMLKSQTGTLTIIDNQRTSKVYQGFYGGQIKLSGSFKTLILKDINSLIFLDSISATTVIIENCPAAIFRNSISDAGASTAISRLEVRNSYLTIYQDITVDELYCYRRSTVIQKKGTTNTVGFVEAGSTLVCDSPDNTNEIHNIDIAKIQGLFYTVNPPSDKPYLAEVFLDHKPISFQRAQVDDQLPLENATVHIYLKHSKTPEPGPGPSPEPPSGLAVDTRYTPFSEYTSVTLSDTYMGVLPGYQNIENNIGLGIMYGISLFEYGNTPVGWLYARIFRTYLMLGWYKVYSTNLTEEGRALLNPETGMWSFGTFYNESQLLQKVRADGTQAGLENFYYMLKYGSVMTGYTDDMDDIDKMKIIAGGAPTGNNSETRCPQDHQFHENYYAAGIVDASWIYDSSCSWVPYGTGRMTYYSARNTSAGGQINPNI